MPREVVALVSADDLVSAVRVHADRVHDLLRRSGCGEAESIEVCESYAFALIDAIVNAPETVGDMAGWWFGRALELARRLGRGSTALTDAPASVLSGTSGEAQVRAALDALPEQERSAVMLRDGYDLPPQAVAVALGRSVDGAAEVVAQGRLHLVATYDARPAPSLAGHTGRLPVDPRVLGRLADGSLPPQRTVPLRRHVAGCHACEDVVETQAKGRRLATGLPVVAMPDEAREAMLERVAARAAAVLPTVDEVLLAIEEEHDVRPAISPITVILAIVLALVLGIGIAAIANSNVHGQTASVDSPPPLVPVQPSFSLSPTPSRHRHRTRPTPSVTPSATASATPSHRATPSATPSRTARPAAAAIGLSPASGSKGTTFTVIGRGWQPGTTVALTYRAQLGGSSTSATVGSNGRFTAQLTASATLPGSYVVQARSGADRASAVFRQTA